MLAGNPSSVHGFGRDVRKRIEDARERIAALVDCAPAELVFTAGGTEANNTALPGRRPADLHRERHRASCHPAHGRGRGGGPRRPAGGRRRRSRHGGARRGARRARAGGTGLRHAGQQRDRRDPACGRDRGAGEGGGRAGALRCGAGAGPHPGLLRRARRRHDEHRRPQVRGPQGDRRARGALGPRHRAAGHRRRAGAGPARRGQRTPPASSASAPPPCWPRTTSRRRARSRQCVAAWKPGCARPSPTSSSSAKARRGSPTRAASPCRACRAKRRSWASISQASR